MRRDIQKLRGAHEQQEGLGSQTGEELEGRAAAMTKLLLRSDHHWRIRCATLISYRKAIMVQSLESRHENSGLSDASLRVHIIKPNVYMIK